MFHTISAAMAVLWCCGLLWSRGLGRFLALDSRAPVSGRAGRGVPTADGVAAVCVVLWMLGMVAHRDLGGWLHLLLVGAAVAVVARGAKDLRG